MARYSRKLAVIKLPKYLKKIGSTVSSRNMIQMEMDLLAKKKCLV
jgi:hypothetical protein